MSTSLKDYSWKILPAQQPQIPSNAMEFVMISPFLRALMSHLVQNEVSAALSSSEAEGSVLSVGAAISLPSADSSDFLHQR